MVKKNLRQFKGFDFDTNSSDYKKRIDATKKIDTAKLKAICEGLQLSKKGPRDAMSQRVCKFLAAPHAIDKENESESEDEDEDDAAEEEGEEEAEEEEEEEEEEEAKPSRKSKNSRGKSRNATSKGGRPRRSTAGRGKGACDVAEWHAGCRPATSAAYNQQNDRSNKKSPLLHRHISVRRVFEQLGRV